MPVTVIGDGKISKPGMELCNMTQKKLEKILRTQKLDSKNIFILLTDGKNDVFVVEKEKKK
jgi:uncharacterized membrane protein YcaP (DUF421 family)